MLQKPLQSRGIGSRAARDKSDKPGCKSDVDDGYTHRCVEEGVQGLCNLSTLPSPPHKPAMLYIPHSHKIAPAPPPPVPPWPHLCANPATSYTSPPVAAAFFCSSSSLRRSMVKHNTDSIHPHLYCHTSDLRRNKGTSRLTPLTSPHKLMPTLVHRRAAGRT